MKFIFFLDRDYFNVIIIQQLFLLNFLVLYILYFYCYFIIKRF